MEKGRTEGATPDLVLAALCVLVAAAGPRLEPSHARFWALAPLAFAVPLLASFFLQRRGAIVAVRIIQSLLLIACAHLLLLSGLWLLNPYMWGAALLLPWPSLLIGANSIATLQRMAATKEERIRSCLLPAGGCVVIVPLTVLLIGGWKAVSLRLRQPTLTKTTLAAEARSGRWQMLITDTVSGGLHRWRFDEGYSPPLRSVDDPYLIAHGFDVIDGRIALFEGRQATVRNMSTGAIVWQGPKESEELQCIRFDGEDALTYVTVNDIVRLRRDGTREEIGQLPFPPKEGVCPSFSHDGLAVWSAHGFVVLARAGHETARWASSGRPFVSPDGRFILLLQHRLIERIDIATGRVRTLARLDINVPRTHWPQVFSPNGKWFLITSREADPCERRFLAVDVESGRIEEVPVQLPPSSCSRGSTGWTDPNMVRWISNGR